MKISQAKKDKGQECCAYSCKNKPAPKLGGLCFKHYQRKRRKLDPVGVRFTQFRTNALNRSKDFSITLDQFREFCTRTGYCIIKGKRGKNATVDRIDNKKGYHIDNIQLLTLRENVRKYYDEDRHEDDCPF